MFNGLDIAAMVADQPLSTWIEPQVRTAGVAGKAMGLARGCQDIRFAGHRFCPVMILQDAPTDHGQQQCG